MLGLKTAIKSEECWGKVLSFCLSDRSSIIFVYRLLHKYNQRSSVLYINSTTKITLFYSQFVCSLYTQPSICLCLYFCFDLYLLCSIQKKDFFCVILGIQILLFHCPLVCKLYLFARPIDQLLQQQMSRLEAQKFTPVQLGL